MNRNDLARELGVWPCKVDDWLLQGCPAEESGKEWEFNIYKVRIWLEAERIQVGRITPKPSARPIFNEGWLSPRCPICIDRGFPGEKAGKVYALGEFVDGEWHLRRTGIPCGHSAYFPSRKEEFHTNLAEKEELHSEVTVKRKGIRGSSDRTPETRRRKIARLKKAIKEGNYKVESEDIAAKLLNDLLIESALTSNGSRHKRARGH